MGDLNYRINIKGVKGYEAVNGDFAKEWAAVKGLVDKLPDDKHALATLQEGDELSTRMNDDPAQSKVFAGFQTQPPTFKPTFKVKKAFDLSYVEKRVPSWCDRVLWKSLPGFAGHVHPQLYEACKEYKTSDHKPIRAGFEVEILKQLPAPEMRTKVLYFAITGLKASILEHMWADRNHDVPDPFIQFLPEPVDLAISHLDEKAVKKGMRFGKDKLVKTHTINNTYEPNWSVKKKDLTIAVKVCELADLDSCHIHLSVMDHDTLTKHDAVGSISINLGAAYRSQSPYTLDHAPLVMDGMLRGTISCVISAHQDLSDIYHN